MRKAQILPTYTQPIQEIVRSWVKGKRAWSSGGERGKPILGFLLKLFWGKCLTEMTYHLKEVRMSWNHYVHVMRDRERKHSHHSR